MRLRIDADNCFDWFYWEGARKMCEFNDSFVCRSKEKVIIDSFRNLTGIDCVVIYLNEGQPFYSYVSEKLNCCFFQLKVSSEEFGLENALKVMDSISKPYIFFCSGMLMFCAVEAVTEENNRIVFIGGPINTGSMDIIIREKQATVIRGTVIDKRQKCGDYPYISFTNTQYATQLLYNVVKYNYPADKEQTQLGSANILNGFALESDIESNVDFTEQIYDAVDDKKRIVKTIAYVNTNIDKILNYITAEDYFSAKDCFEKLMTQHYYEEVGMTAKGHIITAFCELWQHIVSSRDFALTKEIFQVYCDFIGKISEIKDITSLHSITMHYFNNIYIELIKTYKGNDLDSVVGKTKEYIKKNCLMDINVNTIANNLDFDVSYLCRAFKAETGTTVKNYINTCRILQAAEIMQDKWKSLSDVAREVGFNDSQSFQHSFKNHFGVNPSEYRTIFR